ncbi:ABC transporter ATP-binding protein [Turicimonas muris]|uniref:ABC transporter ATP-binding protein n=1 Tax=Turicimonas muris TaxID=1796652 RepID=A0A227KKP2_9BURK|nr:ABC transporter ATP-binding protein [Turicimonas muris]ANU67025.1 ABC transporter ATP-binding protein [Burkholderiales bacterium YL45]OXE47652.1 ABC transporter ATP-binding protein [Turicimonas muris]QQQ95879.1 ABC transporter ATP-binding protein [Turicimonas muris]
MSQKFLLPALSLENVSKTFYRGNESKQALRDVSFTIEQGDFFGLLGPNGAGKSTLIGVLAKTVKLNSGTIKALGFDLETQWRQFKMCLGIVPQEITFDPFLTVYDTLRLQSGYFGLRGNQKWIERLLDVLDLSDKKNSSVMSLSGGMKRRVLIAQAMVHQPPVIVLDEPTAGVDISLRHRLWEFMADLNRKGHTIILTTHYLEEAEKLCRNVALLNHGKIVTLESTQSLLKEYSKERILFSLPSELPKDFSINCTKLSDGSYCTAYGSPENLHTLLNELSKVGLMPEKLEIGKANLEEAFIRITGK